LLPISLRLPNESSHQFALQASEPLWRIADGGSRRRIMSCQVKDTVNDQILCHLRVVVAANASGVLTGA
jgi:hypothetical protein